MLEKLDTITWERYVVDFPYCWKLGWRGDAHHKICNHGSWDPNNCGSHVVSHMCQAFVVDTSSSTPPADVTTTLPRLQMAPNFELWQTSKVGLPCFQHAAYVKHAGGWTFVGKKPG